MSQKLAEQLNNSRKLWLIGDNLNVSSSNDSETGRKVYVSRFILIEKFPRLVQWTRCFPASIKASLSSPTAASPSPLHRHHHHPHPAHAVIWDLFHLSMFHVYAIYSALRTHCAKNGGINKLAVNTMCLMCLLSIVCHQPSAFYLL